MTHRDKSVKMIFRTIDVLKFSKRGLVRNVEINDEKNLSRLIGQRAPTLQQITFSKTEKFLFQTLEILF